MTSCNGRPDSEYWCCGVNNPACCDTSDAIPIAAVLGDTRPPRISSGLSNGAKAGIGVGVAVGVIAIIAVGVVFWYIRRRRRRNAAVAVAAAAANDNANTNTEMAGMGAAAKVPAPPYQAQAAVQSPQELEGNGVGNRVEKPAETGDVRHELPGESAGGGRSAH
ncbi:hypothetical protein SI65_01140 [Aspergillus cristatus]|uniref:Uncharacterized protein n=1 Tax=Aspergillus cristatus TaxID=573508 RepID=A0A1E3BRZ0_ASPCR|nr:hypothetical protein SI65_01140 [Aspergillus cristatus]